jgi:glycosyltransferase involved in cell wall biosynthesis
VIRSAAGGIVFPEGDVDALVNSLIKLMDNPPLCKSLAECGSRSVREKYAQPTLARRFASTVEEAISRRSQ